MVSDFTEYLPLWPESFLYFVFLKYRSCEYWNMCYMRNVIAVWRIYEGKDEDENWQFTKGSKNWGIKGNGIVF